MARANVPANQTDKTLFDRWYQVRLSGALAGWMHVTEVEQASPGGKAPTIDNQQEINIRIKRGPDAITIRMSTDFVETADGQPITATMQQEFGGGRMEQEMIFKPEGIALVSRSAGREETQMIGGVEPKGQAWLTPAAAQRYMQEQIIKGARQIYYWTLDPSEGKNLIEITMKYGGPAKVQVMGKVAPAVIWEETDSSTSGMPVRAYLDDQGEAVKTDMTLIPGMTMEILEADRDLAQAQVDPPELLASTLVTPDRPIAHPRRVRRAEYELLIEPGSEESISQSDLAAMAAGIPTQGVQRVLPSASLVENKNARDQRVRLRVDLDQPVVAAGAEGAEGAQPDDMQASMMINYKDPKIHELLAQALWGQPRHLDSPRKAEVLRRFVYRFIEAKDLAVGLATASEVARTAEGDCKAHAVLLAALLRAAGIPSRTVTGLVYVDQFLGKEGVFGYHMWTEAWLRPAAAHATSRWVDLDATLDGEIPFDATHIALGASALSDEGMSNDLVRLAPLIGRLQIHVIEANP